MKRFLGIFLLSLFVLSAAVFAWPDKDSKINELDKRVIATVGNEKITFGELQKAFKKNMNRKESDLYQVSMDSVNDFLNLYVNYKLKVQDALDRGFDKDSSVLADIETNRKILAESFYYDKMLVQPAIRKMLQRRKWELKFAIIHIGLPAGQTNNSTKAKEKAEKILKLLNQGVSFAKLARDSSDEKRSAKNGGEVSSYVTAGNIQRPIEDALYSLKPGDVYPKPIFTRYGYFIVKLLEKKPRQKVKVSHILLSLGPDKDTTAVYKKADSLLTLLHNGADFGLLAEENSDDPGSAMNGGSLGSWYSRSSGVNGTGRQLVPEFEKAIFELKDGQISGIVKTDYGLHIIRRDSTMNYGNDEELPELKKAYKRYYFEEDKKHLLDSLKNKYGFKLNEGNMKLMVALFDTSATNLDKDWADLIPGHIASRTLYEFNGKNVKISDFVKMMNDNSALRGYPLNTKGITDAIDKIVDPVVFNLETKNLEEKYPEFKALMNEFRDGILLFKVEGMEVWDKLKFDSTQARKYFDTLSTKYYTEPTYDISEIFVLSDSTAKAFYKKLQQGADFSELAANSTQRAKFREKKGHWGKVNAKNNGLAKMLQDKGIKKTGLVPPMKYENGYSIVFINSYEPVRVKTFEEAIPDFAPQYQDMVQKKLTNQWLARIREKFPVKIYEDRLKDTIAEFKNLEQMN